MRMVTKVAQNLGINHLQRFGCFPHQNGVKSSQGLAFCCGLYVWNITISIFTCSCWADVPIDWAMYDVYVYTLHDSGQSIATSHDLSPQNVVFWEGYPWLFQGNLGG